eukprot:5801621-Pyramimonas_sp.AAC.2
MSGTRYMERLLAQLTSADGGDEKIEVGSTPPYKRLRYFAKHSKNSRARVLKRHATPKSTGNLIFTSITLEILSTSLSKAFVGVLTFQALRSLLQAFETQPNLKQSFVSSNGIALIKHTLNREILEPRRLALQIIASLVLSGAAQPSAYANADIIEPMVSMLGDFCHETVELAARTVSAILSAEKEVGPMHFLILSVGAVDPLLKIATAQKRSEPYLHMPAMFS